MISPQYAAPVAALLALALVPTVIHSYRGVRLDDGLRAASVPSTFQGMTSSSTARRPGWVENTFATEDWIERTFKVDGTDVTLFVARSFDAKRLYHHPELALLRGMQTEPLGVVRSLRRPDVPLYLVSTARDMQRGLAVYALRYDGTYIDDPLKFQLRTAFEHLVSGRKPLTLFMASALAGSADALEEAAATKLLLATIAEFERLGPATDRTD